MGKMLYFGNLDVCDYVKRHDLVFLSPVCDPLYQGIPLGDGDTGVLFHLKPNAILSTPSITALNSWVKPSWVKSNPIADSFCAESKGP